MNRYGRQTEGMRRPMRLHTRAWLLAAAVIVLVAGHVIVLYYFSAHLALPAAVVSGVVVLVVIKHLGLLCPLYALFQRRGRARKNGPAG